MTPRSSCPGGEYYSSPGRKPPAHYEINTVTETAPHFARLPAGLCPSYKLPGSFLASTGGSVLARAEVVSSNGVPGRYEGSRPIAEVAWTLNPHLAIHLNYIFVFNGRFEERSVHATTTESYISPWITYRF